jgi:hypothetical protein
LTGAQKHTPRPPSLKVPTCLDRRPFLLSQSAMSGEDFDVVMKKPSRHLFSIESILSPDTTRRPTMLVKDSGIVSSAPVMSPSCYSQHRYHRDHVKSTDPAADDRTSCPSPPLSLCYRCGKYFKLILLYNVF